MPELYLIAHKVRGEQAFDVALRMDCPECAKQFDDGVVDSPGCAECDSQGYWWIIPTSGHRAHPYWSAPMDYIQGLGGLQWPESMPNPWPDHYHVTAAPEQVRERLENLLARLPKPVKQPIKRR